MLVFGDQARRVAPGALLDEIARLWAEIGHTPPGLARHALFAELLIESGGLAQGVIDRAFHARGYDELGGGEDEEEDGLALVVAAARALWASYRGGLAESGSRRAGGGGGREHDRRHGHGARFEAGTGGGELLRGEAFATALAAAERRRWPDGDDAIEVKLAEGFAFYALYPEGYALAAATLAAKHEAVRDGLQVIGLRTIGLTLGAVVHAATRARRPLVSLRPIGHPFARELRVGDDLAAALDGAAAYAVVDEGPGLSGSSFGAAGDFLESRGVAPDRIHFFPSHGGDPGPSASPRHQERWSRARRHVVDFDPRSLWASRWGSLWGGDGEDIGAGAWRAHLYTDERTWPPCHLQQERRKFLLRDRDAISLRKFVGLGRAGRLAERRARILADRGFAPPVRGLIYGFLDGEWLAEARPLGAYVYPDRERLCARVADYLAFVATTFTDAGSDDGAPPEALLAGARHNLAHLLGEEVARRLDRWRPMLHALARAHRPVRTDNRMHAWEWIARGDGRLLKTDGLDHHAAHDRIGCQDIAWDVAAAAVELDLDAGERVELAARVAARAGRLPPEKLRFYEVGYLGFQIGLWHLAAASSPGAEAARCEAARDRYARALVRLLDGA